MRLWHRDGVHTEKWGGTPLARFKMSNKSGRNRIFVAFSAGRFLRVREGTHTRTTSARWATLRDKPFVLQVVSSRFVVVVSCVRIQCVCNVLERGAKLIVQRLRQRDRHENSAVTTNNTNNGNSSPVFLRSLGCGLIAALGMHGRTRNFITRARKYEGNRYHLHHHHFWSYDH